MSCAFNNRLVMPISAWEELYKDGRCGVHSASLWDFFCCHYGQMPEAEYLEHEKNDSLLLITYPEWAPPLVNEYCDVQLWERSEEFTKAIDVWVWEYDDTVQEDELSEIQADRWRRLFFFSKVRTVSEAMDKYSADDIDFLVSHGLIEKPDSSLPFLEWEFQPTEKLSEYIQDYGTEEEQNGKTVMIPRVWHDLGFSMEI